MNNVWNINLDTFLEIMELAKKRGKKAGESMQEEFEEVRKKHPEKFKHLGTTDKDGDLLTGDLREEGIKVLNLDEIERGKK